MSSHYNKVVIDLKNQKDNKMLRKRNDVLFQTAFDDVFTRKDKEYWNYIRISNNEIELNDSILAAYT